MAQPITRDFLRDVLDVVALPDRVVEFGSLQVEERQDSDIRHVLAGREVLGTDFRAGPGVDRVEDLRGLSFADGEIGTAVCLDTLEHCADPVAAVREMHRVLRPDGGVCLISSVMLFGIHGYPQDFFRFTPEGFATLLEPFDEVVVCGVGDPEIPREVFGVGIRGGSLDGLDLCSTPRLRAYQRHWELAAHGIRVGPFVVPPRELALMVRRDLRRYLRARRTARRERA